MYIFSIIRISVGDIFQISCVTKELVLPRFWLMLMGEIITTER
jgi:hypothetical protein